MSVLIDSRLIGQSIRALRKRSRLTQSDLADAIGYSIRNIRRIETDGTANLDIVNVFASYFNVSAMDILQGCLLFYFLRIIEISV